LKCIHLAPSLEAVSPNTGFYSITLGLVRSNQSGFRLTFQGEEGTNLRNPFLVVLEGSTKPVADLFEFQEWMTGYKVVDDLSVLSAPCPVAVLTIIYRP
jgi:hypothetical protein